MIGRIAVVVVCIIFNKNVHIIAYYGRKSLVSIFSMIFLDNQSHQRQQPSKIQSISIHVTTKQQKS